MFRNAALDNISAACEFVQLVLRLLFSQPVVYDSCLSSVRHRQVHVFDTNKQITDLKQRLQVSTVGTTNGIASGHLRSVKPWRAPFPSARSWDSRHTYAQLQQPGRNQTDKPTAAASSQNAKRFPGTLATAALHHPTTGPHHRQRYRRLQQPLPV